MTIGILKVAIGVLLGKRIRLSAVRSCGMDITPSMALDMCGNLHRTIPYLLRGEWKNLETKSYVWIGNMRS